MSTGPQSLRLTLLNILFPQRCIACTRYGSLLCMGCAIVRSEPELLVGATKPNARSIQTLLSAGNYHVAELGTIMEQYKFHAVQDLVDVFALMLWHAAVSVRPTWLLSNEPVYIIPIPLHRKRIRERGFDQNLLLAQAFVHVTHKHGATHIHLAPHLVTRERYTQHQTSVNAAQRHDHLHGAFRATSPQANAGINEKSTLVLLDDIVTTGATFDHVSSVLFAAGYESIHTAAILRAK